jgi:integrase
LSLWDGISAIARRRRSFTACSAIGLGTSADVKDAQAQMRHSRSSTTLDIYQQFVPESQQRVVAGLSRLVN